MQKTITSRALSLFLALALVFGVMTMSVFATDNPDPPDNPVAVGEGENVENEGTNVEAQENENVENQDANVENQENENVENQDANVENQENENVENQEAQVPVVPVVPNNVEIVIPVVELFQVAEPEYNISAATSATTTFGSSTFTAALTIEDENGANPATAGTTSELYAVVTVSVNAEVATSGVLTTTLCTATTGVTLDESDTDGFTGIYELYSTGFAAEKEVTQGANGSLATYKMAFATLEGDLDNEAFEVRIYFEEGDVDDNNVVVPGGDTGNTGTPSGNTGSSGSSGGSSGGSGSSTTNPATQKSANVSADGSVNSTKVATELKTALDAIPAGGNAVVSVKNATSISASTIKALANEAANTGKTAVIHADTLAADGSVQGRLYVEPAKLTNVNGDIKLGIATQGRDPEKRKMTFEKFFENKVSVVSCAQQGSFGAKLKIAAKVELPKKTDNLVFYSYDAKTNKYTKIDTTYRVDKNGYLHFETGLAGDIIISDGELVKK